MLFVGDMSDPAEPVPGPPGRLRGLPLVARSFCLVVLFSLATLYPDETEDRLMEAMTDSDPGLRKWAKMTLEKTAARPLKRKTVSLIIRG